jgi:UDP-MurNAc hydroxylase
VQNGGRPGIQLAGSGHAVQIQFINHASVKLVTSQCRITSDPWYAGAAFNNGWDLICNDPELAEIGADATHYWLSHEHPDHFSIQFFKTSPNRAPVLFQDTSDHRVASFLRKEGFAVHEICEKADFEVAPGETIRIARCGFYDSWNIFRAEGLSVLNLNDCELNSDADLAALAASLGPIDVLLTQFSYAAWKGGRDNRALREGAAREKLATVRRQIEHLKPRYVIPFASFVYFSHVENAYLNDSMNDIPRTVDAIHAAGAIPIILKPADCWTIGEPRDNTRAIAYWREAYASIGRLPQRLAAEQVSMQDLAEHCRRYKERVFAKNSKSLIRLGSLLPLVSAFRPLVIHLTDLDRIVRFSFFEELAEAPAGAAADVEMSSESLDFIFLNEFGYDTLTVNGRFEASTDGFGRMTKNFAIGSLNALGLALKPSLMFNADVVLLLLTKLRSFMRKMDRSKTAS